MALTKADIIELRLRELLRDYFQLNRPAAEAACPVLLPVADSRGLNFEYQYVDASGAELVGDPAVLTTETQLLTDASIGLDKQSFSLDQYDLGVFRISDSTADAFTTAVDVNAEVGARVDAAGEFSRSILSRAYALHSRRLKVEAEAQLAGEVLNFTDSTFPSDLADVLNDILKASGKRPNTIVLGPDDLTVLAAQDFIRDFAAISITSTDKARTGYANESDVAAYFAGKHQLRLVTDATAWRPTSVAAREFIWQQRGALVYVDGLASTLRTAVQYSGEIAKVEVRRNSDRSRIGFNVPGEAIFKIHAFNPETGRYISTDGSSLS
jgi:hypothetical protein